MAEEKKVVAAVTPAAKAVAAKAAPAKAEEKKPVEAAKEVKPVAKKAAAKKPAAKKAAAKPAAKKAAAKPAAKKAAAKPAAKKATALKAVVNYQLAGQDYTEAKFIENAKNVWKYDLGKKVSELKTVELYVKPEEGKVYFVANGDVDNTYSFDI